MEDNLGSEDEDFVLDLGSPAAGLHEADIDRTANGMLSKLYLVGHLVTKKSISVAVIKSQIKKTWIRKGDFTVINKANNVFLVGFQFEEDRLNALDGTHWLVSNQHFCLKEWPMYKAINQLNFEISSFWVQLHDFPPDLISLARISQLSGVFPKVLEVETSLDNLLEWHGYFSLGSRCGLLDHTIGHCQKAHRADKGVRKCNMRSYGPWMRGQLFKGKHYPALKPKGRKIRTGTSDKEKQGRREEGGPSGSNTLKNQQYAEEPPPQVPSSPIQLSTPVSKKRKLEEDPPSAINEVTTSIHHEWVESFAQLAVEVTPEAPARPSTNRTRWKKLARQTQLVYNPNEDEVEWHRNMEDHGVPFMEIMQDELAKEKAAIDGEVVPPGRE
ncbi:hypothetical protein Tsubulata_029985 [Turnera subulata]|uniref:DUF4283 domain-containing protein n=1 Tax=Turnera subulata TaxID=218843 RepID=A0A9Q0FUE0_9ROSI|nr:hypothetical protein Tsubulata_029985 [Turnera subulata]